MRVAFPDLLDKIDDVTVDFWQLVNSTHQARIRCAAGETDSESIVGADEDSDDEGALPANAPRPRWRRRLPYWYTKDEKFLEGVPILEAPGREFVSQVG